MKKLCFLVFVFLKQKTVLSILLSASLSSAPPVHLRTVGPLAVLGIERLDRGERLKSFFLEKVTIHNTGRKNILDFYHISTTRKRIYQQEMITRLPSQGAGKYKNKSNGEDYPALNITTNSHSQFVIGKLAFRRAWPSAAAGHLGIFLFLIN